MDKDQNSQKVNLSKCPKGNQSTLVCFNQHCNNKALICKDLNCQCRSSHKMCLLGFVDKIEQIILANSYSLEPLEKQIKDVFDTSIDKLSEERDRILKEVQDKFHYLGLSKMERKFIDVIKKGFNDAQITCQFVWKMQNQLRGQNALKQGLDHVEKQILKIGEDFVKDMNNFSNKFTKLLQEVKEKEEEIFLKSKIVKTIEDQNKLLAFFTQKKVIGAQLLYRASQNEFLMSKFHQKCDNIPHTLAIVQTEFGKVMGGFTSFSWFKTKTPHYVSSANNTVDHFMFSLTNNHKLLLTQNCANCIYQESNDSYGLRFGGGHDLIIFNKANENNSSYANPGSTYTNANYVAGDNASHIKFGGAKNFKVKQWQVWRVLFNQ